VLTQALLAARGIAAEAALVNYGEAFAPLPLWMPTQYNHAIVYLPEWHRFINPTDPFASFDAADRRLAGKQVVLATPAGAVARIPQRRPEDNIYRLDSTLDLAPDGTITGRATLALSASIDSASRRMMANALSPQDLAERLLEETPEGGFGSVTSSNPRDLDTPFVMNAAWTSPHAVALHGGVGYAAVPAGIDIEQPAALRSLLSPKHPPAHDFTAGAFDFSWHISLRLPAGLTAVRLPADVDLANAAGRYVASYRLTGGRIEVSRHLTVAKDVFPAGEYAAFDALIQQPLSDAREVIGFAPQDVPRVADRLVEASATASP
jgi:hypothetical protein